MLALLLGLPLYKSSADASGDTFYRLAGASGRAGPGLPWSAHPGAGAQVRRLHDIRGRAEAGAR